MTEQGARGQDNIEVFQSPEQAELIRTATDALFTAAQEADAVKLESRDIERVELVHDPQSSRPMERHVHVETPKLNVSEWHAKRGENDMYRILLSKNPDDSTSQTLISFESSIGISGSTWAHGKEAGVDIAGRRIQDYTVNNDGKVYGRSTDYTVSWGPYRVVSGTSLQWEATTKEVAFLRNTLSEAVLAKDGEPTDVQAKNIAPDLAI